MKTLNNNFDKNKFIELLKKAIGKDTQKSFAIKIHLSPAHLSRLLHGKFDTPPQIETLKKISAYSQNVSYMELLYAAGYVDTTFLQNMKQEPYNIKLMTAAIISSFQSSNLEWSIIKNSKYDLCIIINSKSHWYFQFLSNANTIDVIEYYFIKNYSNLIFEPVNPNDQYTFVTMSDLEYETYVKKSPKNLAINLSLILIDNNMNIIKESLLQTHYNIGFSNHYHLKNI